ncbi:MAG: sulfite exporter TauE/SafE family protein [Methanomassiliicoccales archaeon]|nr:sulfite exporter TauE/SafE family protein [Methanomassiliicoccales archaeon]
MELIFVIALLITGLGVGLASGMLGVGGCFIMIPVQYWALTSMGLDSKLAILVAFGTNLLVVLPTALSGAYRHSKKKAVLWRPAMVMGISGGMTSILGVYVATQLSGNMLTVIFGLVIIASAVRMLTAKPPKNEENPPENDLPYVLAGLPLGFLCGLIGIGGGVLMIPVMVVGLRFSMHKAVGTSTALMAFIAFFAAICYIAYGWNVSGLPDHSIGYVNLLQFILLAATSVPMAQAGAHLAHKIPAKQLKYVFIIVMVYMGIKMTGVFSWLGLPL